MQPDPDWGPASLNKQLDIENTEIPLTPKEFEHQRFTFDGYEYRKVICAQCHDNSVHIRIDTYASGDTASDQNFSLENVSMRTDDVLKEYETTGSNEDVRIPQNQLLINSPPHDTKAKMNDLKLKFFSESMDDRNRTISETSHTESDEVATVQV